MKKKVMTLFVICLAFMAIVPSLELVPAAQAAPPRRVEAVNEADPMPVFPGGMEAFEKFINDHLTFPTNARERKEYEGAKIQISLIVMSDGSAGPFNVFKDPTRPNTQLGEMEGILKQLPKFEPGKVNGKPVNVNIMIPVTLNPPVDSDKE